MSKYVILVRTTERIIRSMLSKRKSISKISHIRTTQPIILQIFKKRNYLSKRYYFRIICPKI